MAELEQNPPKDFSMATLDRYEDTELKLVTVLAYLPAEAIHSGLGDDALFWTWAKYFIHEQKEALRKGIQRVTGRDSERIEKARLTAWRLLYTDRAGLVKAIYDLDEAVLGGIADSIDLPVLLQANARDGVQLSDRRLSDYSLRPLTSEGRIPERYAIGWDGNINQNGDRQYYIWLDSPVALALAYKGEPNAVVGFFPCDLKAVMICQLQGVKSIKIGADGEPFGFFSSRGLMPIDWQKLLVDCVGAIAQQFGYSQLEIQSGHNNTWTQPKEDGRIHLPLEKALQKYDAVAERLGFEQGENKNWYKRLG